MMIRLPLTALLALLLTACALSPQYVAIDPTIDVQQQMIADHVAMLEIKDRRTKSELGTRGGVYADTSYIYPSQPLAQSLRPAALKALQGLGLDTEGRSPKPIAITLFVDELSYRREGSGIPAKIHLESRISVLVEKDGRRHEGSFGSSQSHSFVKAPNETENRKIINDVLSQTLTRLFNDQRLIDFIRH